MLDFKMIYNSRQALRTAVIALVVLLQGAAGIEAAPATGKVEFARDVMPIMSGTCFTCHGPDEATRKSGLRLDIAEESRKLLKSGSHAIVPGKPGDSEAIVRIFATDEDDLMPPRKSNLKLTAAQKEILKRWVEQGAEYQGHWAYESFSQPAVPQPKQSDGARNAIDRFILANLETKGMKPSPQADRFTLVRRLSMDLTGLPPTLELADRFVKDQRPDAYERLVDELLAQPAYGEHFTATWLDLARYADSNGYAEDQKRNIWRYRDWVIQAINSNMPFDQFTVEQIAGDMLPDASDLQVLATAFNRNTLTNTEGGTNDEEFRSFAIVDRVNTTMQVWMGVTAACSQCHDHKYDPLKQEEYFQLYAIFNQSADSDRGDNAPLLEEFTPEIQQKKDELVKQIAALEKEIEVKKQALLEKQQKEAEKNLLPAEGPIKTRFVRVENLGNGVYLHLAEVEAFAGKENVARKGKASQISTDFGGPPERAIDGNTSGTFTENSVTHTAAADNAWWEVDLQSAQAIDRIVIWNRGDGVSDRLKDWRIIALDEKRQPVWVQTFHKPADPSVTVTLPALAKDLSAQTRDEIVSYGKGAAPASKLPEQDKLEKLRKELASVRGVMTPIMRELPAKSQRKTHIQLRGDFMSLGKEVVPGTPAFLPPLSSDAKPDRLGLARWLVSPENPLTSRVAVNRYWDHFMGHGLVETPDDFGIRGGLPNHPQLLNWLASEFMKQNWDVKQLIKLIVTSATYRQDSRVTPEQLEQDSDNKQFARGPRFRLTAEMVRDQSLMIAGLLTNEVGGPSVRPPRPKLGLSAAFGPSTDWTDSTGDDRHRRGIYTEWRRSSPYPSMTTFDATARTVCTIRRPRTNTPLQALVTMNDPVYVEAAQGLARRIMNDGGNTIEARAAYGLRLTLIRPPSAAEVKRIVMLFEKVREGFAASPADAKSFATEPIGALPKEMDVIDAAAWSLVGNVLLNLDETLSKR